MGKRNIDRNIEHNIARNIARNMDRNIERYQKCPLIFFILCGYIDKYIPTFTYNKKFPPAF